MSQVQSQTNVKANCNWQQAIFQTGQNCWFGPNADPDSIEDFGIRVGKGGVHNSKTLLYRELEALMSRGARDSEQFRKLAVEENVLDKATQNSRTITYGFLSSLYGLRDQPPLTKLFFGLWENDTLGRRLLALLVTLARDPLFRQTAIKVMEGRIGESMKSHVFEEVLVENCPNRYSERSRQSISRNCASSWTQSGHLMGSKMKIRQRVVPSPQTVAFAAAIATAAGFSGPAMLNSDWFRVLDLNREQGLKLLGQAEALGFAKVRTLGDVTEISVRKPISIALGVPEIAQFG